PGLPRLLLVPGQRERGDDDDGNGGGRRVGVELPGGLEPGELRELDVHDDQVRNRLARGRNARLPVRRLDQAIGRANEQVPDDLAVELVILDVQDRLHAGASLATVTGIEKKKVEPLPGTLSTQ